MTEPVPEAKLETCSVSRCDKRALWERRHERFGLSYFCPEHSIGTDYPIQEAKDRAATNDDPEPTTNQVPVSTKNSSCGCEGRHLCSYHEGVADGQESALDTCKTCRGRGWIETGINKVDTDCPTCRPSALSQCPTCKQHWPDECFQPGYGGVCTPCRVDGAPSERLGSCVTHHICDCLQKELDAIRPVVEAALADVEDFERPGSTTFQRTFEAVDAYREATNG